MQITTAKTWFVAFLRATLDIVVFFISKFKQISESDNTYKSKQKRNASSSIIKDDEDSKTTANTVGVVTYAQESVVGRVGKKPYKLFTVYVEKGGVETTFCGVELQKKFLEGKFGLGDKIEITQSRTEIEINGKKRIKNLYEINVLQKAKH